MRKLAVVLFLVAACQSEAPKPATLEEGDNVLVTSTIKGDELLVKKGEGEARVRLLGIHAFSAVLNDPQIEALSAGGQSALTDYAKGKTVTLHFDRTRQDSSGRYLAYVEVDGTDIGKKLIQEGWAVTYTEFPFLRERDYLSAETTAREAQKNLWGLKPAAELVRGLRKQWAEARPSNGGGALADPLLSQAPAPVATP